jgi:lysozyme
MSREQLFAAIRPFAPGQQFTPEHVAAIDALADSFGISRGGERTLGAAGLQIIKDAEGLRLSAYQDTGGVWTIGYGHTGADVHPKLTISEVTAEALLRRDVADAEVAVRRLFPKTTQNQFDALVSFTFNEGAGQVEASSLRRLHNDGDYAGAQSQFARWIYDDHKALPGLVKRRRAEADLYGRAA